ncbi:unnamed protein product [Anisakis simplex]|uniref:Cyclin N-terminal domain-containing protein n=1 Tax=Anisakis simplex TaxID=6269 RepID=A0A0M3J1L2_ANISI|nr:unnamed protein product [Anisakis simplex]
MVTVVEVYLFDLCIAENEVGIGAEVVAFVDMMVSRRSASDRVVSVLLLAQRWALEQAPSLGCEVTSHILKNSLFLVVCFEV